MQEVYVVKNYEDKLNMYIMGIFSSDRKATEYIEAVEDIRKETIFDIKVVKYTVDKEDLLDWVFGFEPTGKAKNPTITTRRK